MTDHNLTADATIQRLREERDQLRTRAEELEPIYDAARTWVASIGIGDERAALKELCMRTEVVIMDEGMREYHEKTEAIMSDEYYPDPETEPALTWLLAEPGRAGSRAIAHAMDHYAMQEDYSLAVERRLVAHASREIRALLRRERQQAVAEQNAINARLMHDELIALLEHHQVDLDKHIRRDLAAVCRAHGMRPDAVGAGRDGSKLRNKHGGSDVSQSR